MKIIYSKKEVKELEEEAYLNKEELEILEYWILGYSMVQISEKVKLSTSTISRRKKTILEKIERHFK